MKTFLFIFGFSWFFFSLFEIFALLFFSSQILSLSLAFTVFDTKNMKCEFHGPRGEESTFTNFVVLFFGREISVLGDWVPSLMKLETLLCIGKKKTKTKKERCFKVLCWSERAQGCIHRAAGSANSFELSWVLHPQLSKLFVAFVNSSPLRRGSSLWEQTAVLGQDQTGRVSVRERVLKRVFSFL